MKYLKTFETHKYKFEIGEYLELDMDLNIDGETPQPIFQVIDRYKRELWKTGKLLFEVENVYKVKNIYSNYSISYDEKFLNYVIIRRIPEEEIAANKYNI